MTSLSHNLATNDNNKLRTAPVVERRAQPPASVSAPCCYWKSVLLCIKCAKFPTSSTPPSPEPPCLTWPLKSLNRPTSGMSTICLLQCARRCAFWLWLAQSDAHSQIIAEQERRRRYRRTTDTRYCGPVPVADTSCVWAVCWWRHVQLRRVHPRSFFCLCCW